MNYEEQVREDSRVDEVWERQDTYRIPKNRDRFYPDSYHMEDYTLDREDEE